MVSNIGGRIIPIQDWMHSQVSLVELRNGWYDKEWKKTLLLSRHRTSFALGEAGLLGPTDLQRSLGTFKKCLPN